MKVIIDGNYALHRAYHVFKTMNQGGFKTGTTYGLVRDVMVIADKFKTTDIHVAWDSRSFRKDLSDDYKSNRVPVEGDTPYENHDTVMKMLELMGIKQYRVPGMESDDILWTLSRDPEPTIVYSRDRDILQCLSETCSVIRDLKEEPYTLESFEKEYEFPFSRDGFVFWKCVVGDGSDNIKGIPRFQKKELKKILRQEKAADKALNIILENKELIEKNKEIFNLHFIENIEPLPGEKNQKELELLSLRTGVVKPFQLKGAKILGVNFG